MINDADIAASLSDESSVQPGSFIPRSTKFYLQLTNVKYLNFGHSTQ